MIRGICSPSWAFSFSCSALTLDPCLCKQLHHMEHGLSLGASVRHPNLAGTSVLAPGVEGY